MGIKTLEKAVLIDDDDKYYNILKPKLEKCGYILKWAKNGEEGIFISKKIKPRFVITDIVMPRINGFELIKELKRNPDTANTKFIILSDWGEARLVYDVKFLDSLGIMKYLVKSSHTPTEVFREIKILFANEN